MKRSGNQSSAATDKTYSSAVSDNPNDAHIIITLTDNDLEAWGDFNPALGDGQSYDYDKILGIFDKLNINCGIQEEAIQNALMECNLERKPVQNILLARGIPPENGVEEYLQLNPQLVQSKISTEDNKKVDYRTYSPFIIVKKDQALAKLKSQKPGQEGTNVRGEPIPNKTIRPEGVTGGDNTRMEGRFLLANINGQMVDDKKVIHVRDTLYIKGAVGYKTGNITFPGDVIIEGTVSDGFKIYSGGSITINQTFDVTEAVSKEDLNVAGGIIGRGRAKLKVGGNLRAKFIENCTIACRKKVEVTTEIINSEIYTLENVEMGEKGYIVGGEIYALHGVSAAGIGKKALKSARIHCGIDFILQQEKEKNNNMLRLLAAKLERLKELLENTETQGEKRTKLEELQSQLKEQQRVTSEKVSELMGRINADEKAVIEVSGEIAPRTLIEICQIALFVTEPLKKVRISLDRRYGKLITTPL